jgi:glycosyltransferase involved in cell wall biosynthesis
MSHSPRAINGRHIALFARSLAGGGGVERVVIQLAGALADRGHRVDIVLARQKGHFVSEIPASVRLVSLDAGSALQAIPTLMRLPGHLAALLPTMMTPGVAQVIGAVPRLARYLREERPEALLAALDYANITAILAQEVAQVPALRVVATVHNHMTSAVENAERPHLRRVAPLARRFYCDANALVCVSDGVAADLASITGLPRARIETIYNPVVTAQLDSLAAAPLSHPWFDAGAPPVILGVGKLRRQKDFVTLIRAFAILKSTHAARLVILGEGPERAALSTLAHDLGCGDDVELAGFEANPYRYMSRAAVFALSSAWEGFGNVLVEALACGCPVVSTDCPSGPREILDDGRFGPLVPVADPRALADAIRARLTAPPDPAAGRARAAAFTDATSAEHYERVLFPAASTRD